VDNLVSHTDFAPTFLEAAGLEVPEEMTGQSLLPVLFTEGSGIVGKARDQLITGIERHTWCRPDGATYPVRAIRTMDYLLLINYEPDRWPTGGPEFVSSNRTFHGDVDACPTKSFMVEPENQVKYATQYQLCFGKRPDEELYEIAYDPYQIHNLADDPAYKQIKEDLRKRLEDHLKATGDPRMEGKDPWQAYIYHQTDGFGATYNMSLPEHERARHALRPGN
jgi:uncharacterized sulfatase